MNVARAGGELDNGGLDHETTRRRFGVRIRITAVDAACGLVGHGAERVQQRRLAELFRQLGCEPLQAAGPDQRLELLQAGSGLAFQDRPIGNRPEYKLEGTPLEVNGVVYATAGSRRAVIALDAVTGELLWVHGEKEGARGAAAPRQLSGRGPRLLERRQGCAHSLCDARLSADRLDAKTGQRVASFGNNGAVDLKADDDQKIEPDLTTGEIGWQSAPTVVGDEVLIGSAFREGFTPDELPEQQGLGARL